MEPFVHFWFAFRRWARGLSLVMLGLGLAYCATMRGTVSGGRYTSPDGRVSVAVPSFSGTGRFQEHHDSSYFAVIMADDTGALVTISHHGGDLPTLMDEVLGLGKRQREIDAGDKRRAIRFAQSVRYQPKDPNPPKP